MGGKQKMSTTTRPPVQRRTTLDKAKLAQQLAAESFRKTAKVTRRRLGAQTLGNLAIAGLGVQTAVVIGYLLYFNLYVKWPQHSLIEIDRGYVLPGDELNAPDIRSQMSAFVAVVMGLAWLAGFAAYMTSDRGWFRLITILEVSVTSVINLQTPVIKMRGYASVVLVTGLVTSYLAYKTAERIQEEGNKNEKESVIKFGTAYFSYNCLNWCQLFMVAYIFIVGIFTIGFSASINWPLSPSEKPIQTHGYVVGIFLLIFIPITTLIAMIKRHRFTLLLNSVAAIGLSSWVCYFTPWLAGHTYFVDDGPLQAQCAIKNDPRNFEYMGVKPNECSLQVKVAKGLYGVQFAVWFILVAVSWTSWTMSEKLQDDEEAEAKGIDRNLADPFSMCGITIERPVDFYARILMVSAGLHAFFSLIMIIPTAFFEHKNHNSKTLSFIREHTYSWVFIFMSFGASIFTFLAAKLRRRGMLIAVTIIMFWIIGYAYQMCIYLTSYLQHGMPMQVVDFNLIQFPTDVNWFKAKKANPLYSEFTDTTIWPQAVDVNPIKLPNDYKNNNPRRDMTRCLDALYIIGLMLAWFDAFFSIIMSEAVQDEKDLKPSLQTESVLEHAGYKGKSVTGGKPADLAARIAAERQGDDEEEDFDDVAAPAPAPAAAAPPPAAAPASEEIKPSAE